MKHQPAPSLVSSRTTVLLCALSIGLILSAARILQAEPLPAPSVSEQPSHEGGIFRKTGLAAYDLGKDVVLDGYGALLSPRDWDGMDWLTVGAVGATTGLLFLVDDEVHDEAHGNKGFEDFGDGIRPVGKWPGAVALTGGFLVSGYLLDRPQDRTTSRLILEAAVVNQALVEGMKAGLGRKRPREEDGNDQFAFLGGDKSFPSGEVSLAFTMATVVSEQYDRWPVKIASYGLATAVAAGRIGMDAHWTSDVFFSAALSVAMTRAIVHRHRQRHGEPTEEKSALIVYPGGIQWVRRF